MVFFYVPFALLFRLLSEVRWTRRLLLGCGAVLLGLALVFVGIGFWEYDRRELLWNPKVISANQFESYFRVNSVFWDPNVYGRFLALVIVRRGRGDAVEQRPAAGARRGRGARDSVGRSRADVLAVELRGAAGRARGARGAALERAPRAGRERARDRRPALCSCWRSRAR